MPGRALQLSPKPSAANRAILPMVGWQMIAKEFALFLAPCKRQKGDQIESKASTFLIERHRGLAETLPAAVPRTHRIFIIIKMFVVRRGSFSHFYDYAMHSLRAGWFNFSRRGFFARSRKLHSVLSKMVRWYSSSEITLWNGSRSNIVSNVSFKGVTQFWQ